MSLSALSYSSKGTPSYSVGSTDSYDSKIYASSNILSRIPLLKALSNKIKHESVTIRFDKKSIGSFPDYIVETPFKSLKTIDMNRISRFSETISSYLTKTEKLAINKKSSHAKIKQTKKELRAHWLETLKFPLKDKDLFNLLDAVEKLKQKIKKSPGYLSLPTRVGDHRCQLDTFPDRTIVFTMQTPETLLEKRASKHVYQAWTLNKIPKTYAYSVRKYKMADLAEGLKESTNVKTIEETREKLKTNIPLQKVYKNIFFENPKKEGNYKHVMLMKYFPMNLKQFTKELSTKSTAFGPRLCRQIKWNYTTQLIQALNFLKNNELLHREIKPENILINPIKQRLVLGDLGSIREAKDESAHEKLEGTTAYLAPELMKPEGKVSYASNMWSAGLSIGNLFGISFPWQKTLEKNEMPSKETMGSVLSEISKFQISLDSSRNITSPADSEVLSLLKKILKSDPTKRLKPSDALNELNMILEPEEGSVKD